MSAEVAVVTFPGTNCEHDVACAIERAGGRARLVWHAERTLGSADAVILPGGFAHGDYLRPGAIARFSPVMAAVGAFAASGGPVVGICNGFQVLTEAQLLPGALQKNRNLAFICDTVDVVVATGRSALTVGVEPGRRLRLPINHFEGNFTCDEATLSHLVEEDRVVLRYADNPNGSAGDIAGITNAAGNVVGLMPHPERATDPLSGSTDGLILLVALLAAGVARSDAAAAEGAGVAGAAR